MPGLPAIPANFGQAYAAGRAQAGGGGNPGLGAMAAFVTPTASTASGGSPFAGVNALAAKYGNHASGHSGGGSWLDMVKAPFWTGMKAVNTPFDVAETALGDALIGGANAVNAATGGKHIN